MKEVFHVLNVLIESIKLVLEVVFSPLHFQVKDVVLSWNGLHESNHKNLSFQTIYGTSTHVHNLASGVLSCEWVRQAVRKQARWILKGTTLRT